MACLPILKKASVSSGTVDNILHNASYVLSKGGDALGLAPIPGLSNAASALMSVIDMAILTRENEETRQALANHARALAELIMATTTQMNAAIESAAPGEQDLVRSRLRTSADLIDRVHALQRNLDEQNENAKKLTSGSFVVRCWGSSRNAVILGDLEKGIERAMKEFQLRGNVTIEMLINGLVERVELIHEAVIRIEKNQTMDADTKTLESLPHADASYRSALNTFKAGLLPGTRVEILETLSAWAHGTNPELQRFPIYVLSGAAGTGKSTIAYEMAKRLEKDDILGASFFFVRGAEGLSSTRLVYSTIAYQLAQHQPTLSKHIVTAARKHLTRGLTQAPEFELDDLIVQPMRTVGSDHKPIVIIIDAVDECTESAQELVPRMLHLLMEAVHEIPFPLRILITTRPELHIQDAFQSEKYTQDTRAFTLHDISRGIVDTDIFRYIQKCLESMRHGVELLKARATAIVDLTKRADGLFIFASTAISFLRQQSEDIIRGFDTLLCMGQDSGHDAEMTMTQLDMLYVVVLRDAFPEVYLERPGAKERVQRILGSFAVLQDHVSPAAMAELAGASLQDVRNVLSRLPALVLIGTADDPRAVIRPLHATFPQFLTNPARCKNPDFYVDAASHHGHLAASCLALLNTHKGLRRNLCRLGDPSVAKDDVPNLRTLVDERVPGYVQYACFHWGTHLSQAGLDQQAQDLLVTFCDSRLLLWLEALSFLDRLDVSVQALVIARTWVQERGRTAILLNDCYRFVLEYYIPINICPEHIYISALLQSPTCALQNSYSRVSGAAMAVKPVTGRDDSWGPCLRAIEGHKGRIQTVKYAPNGRWLASGGNDKTVRIWESSSGIPIHVMRGHTEAVETIDIARDGPRLVSGSSDQTVRGWNTQSGAPIRTVRVGHGNVFAVAFSPDGSRVASGSYNRALHVWDVARGKRLLTITENVGCVNSAVFSADGERILAVCGGKKLRMYDAENGDLLQEFAGHKDSPREAVFFPGDAHIASCADDQTVRVWDTESAECLLTMRGHTGRVFTVDVSSSGALIASGSDDNTVRVWDAKTGDSLAVWKEHTSWVISLAFSPDGAQLATASDDETVRLWDVTAPQNQTAVIGHSLAVDCVAFSRDGKLVATGSEDTTVTIWTVATGERLTNISAHDQRVRSVAFSPDASRIVSAGWDNQVQVSDVASGELVHTLVGHNKGVEAVAWSPDGALVASAANNLEPTLRLWNAVDGTPLRTFQIDFQGAPIDMTRLVEFSPDSARIYCKTINDLEYVWDCATGAVRDRAGLDWRLNAENYRFKEVDGWIVEMATRRRLCWTPGSKRASGESASACFGNCIALGAGSGRFTLLDLSEILDA